MISFDLSEENVENLCRSFASLKDVPVFSVSVYTDVQIVFFKRKDRYFGIRTGLKSQFGSREEFLVYSFLLEDFPSHADDSSSLKQLKVAVCSNEELGDLYGLTTNAAEQLPDISDVKQSYVVVNNSDLNWVFLEDDTNYHSVFWNASESKLFGRCA